MQVLQIPQLFHSDLIISQIKGSQILKVAQIFFDNVDDLLRGQFRFDRLMGQAYSAREQDQETVKQETQPLWCLADKLLWSISLLVPLILAPFETLPGLDRIDNV